MSSAALPEFHAGQCWRYASPVGHDSSRILIGAVVSFQDREPIVCCAVTNAQRLLPSGEVDTVLLPFLPMSASALAATVTDLEGEALLPGEFAAALAEWQGDPRGLAAFTVPFEGRLDVMVARQMVEIADRKAG